MAIYGPNLSRSSFASSAQRMLSLINGNNRKLDTLGAQMASGQRILSPSYDPVGAASWVGHSGVLRRNTVLSGNATSLQQRYDFADSQLGQAADILSQLKTIALRESNATADATTRAASATEVGNLRDALLQLANSEFAGANLFGGRKLTGSSFEAIGSAIKYLGTSDINKVQIGHGVTLDQNLDARAAFGVGTNVVGGKRDLNALATLAITSPPGTGARTTPLASLNGGRGVDTAGTVRISVQPDAALGNTLEFELSIKGAETLEDVAVAINNLRSADGLQVFDATLFTAPGAYPQDEHSVATGIRIAVKAGGPLDGALTPTSTITIGDDLGHTTARDLGLITSRVTHSFESEDLTALAPYTSAYNFDVNVNGNTFSIAVAPPFPDDLNALATSMNTMLTAGMTAAGIEGVTVNVTTTATGLRFDVDDQTGGGYFGMTGTNAAAQDLRLQKAQTVSGPTYALGSVAFTDTLGVSGRDLNPALHLGARLSDLFGGQGLTLETDALGTQRLPQGLRITNGSFSAAINLEPLVSDPNATLNDLKKAIERAGVHVEMRLTPSGIQVASQLSGTPLKVENHNGTLATQLGLDTTAPTGRVDDLNNGLGVDRIAGTDFTLTLPNGHVVNVDIGEASTTAAIAEAINAAQSNVNPSGTPPTYFTASTFRQRTFESMPVAAPDAAFSFNVSFNGEPAQAISIAASGGRTLDQLATEMQTQLNAAARRAGLDGYEVRVAPDAGDTFLQFTVEDTAGVARIAFAGGSTGTLGLGGQLDGNFESRLRGEVVSDRLAVRDNTWTTGAPQALLGGFGGAATADNLGLLNSFDPVTGRFVSTDLKHRGQGDTGLFATLADLVSALQGNSQAAIARQIDRVESAYQKMLDARGEAGSRAQRAQLAQSRLTAESEQVTIMASNVMDTDIAAAAQQFQQTQVVLQAGLSATAAIGQLSLFDYL